VDKEADMVRGIVNRVFSSFNRVALSKEECEQLDVGIEKHVSALRTVLIFVPAQILLAVVCPDLAILLTVIGLLALMLGSAWYAISFQNVSADQLAAGVADFITKRMFRSFLIGLSNILI